MTTCWPVTMLPMTIEALDADGMVRLWHDNNHMP